MAQENPLKAKVLELRKAGISYAKIAEQLNIPWGTVYGWCRRAGLVASRSSSDEPDYSANSANSALQLELPHLELPSLEESSSQEEKAKRILIAALPDAAKKLWDAVRQGGRLTYTSIRAAELILRAMRILTDKQEVSVGVTMLQRAIEEIVSEEAEKLNAGSNNH